MGASRSGHRVAYDRVWGALLVATVCVPPAAAGGEWSFWVAGDPALGAWVLGAGIVGLLAIVLGFAGVRSRSRHAINLIGGCLLVATPLFLPRLWDQFPYVNPARLPLAEVGRTGWVMLLALGAVYAGSGIRVARPSQFVGLGLGTTGALIAAIFACLPEAVGGSGYASAKVLVFREFSTRWVELLPPALGAAAVVCAILNMVRGKAEVGLARASRLLLVGALLAALLLPFFVAGKQDAPSQLRVAWGALRFFAPLFLAIDAAIAFTAISITRSQD
jgi:hypothetical protein